MELCELGLIFSVPGDVTAWKRTAEHSTTTTRLGSVPRPRLVRFSSLKEESKRIPLYPLLDRTTSMYYFTSIRLPDVLKYCSETPEKVALEI